MKREVTIGTPRSIFTFTLDSRWIIKMRPDEHKRKKSAQYQNKKKHTASDKHEGKLPVKKDVDENLKRPGTENLVSE